MLPSEVKIASAWIDSLSNLQKNSAILDMVCTLHTIGEIKIDGGEDCPKVCWRFYGNVVGEVE